MSTRGKGGYRKRNGWYEIYFSDRAGKQRFERVGSRDERVAKRLLRQRLDEVKAGTYVPGGKGQSSVHAYLLAWAGTRTNKNAKLDQSKFRLHILPHLPDSALGQLRVSHILDWLDALRRKGLSPSTIVTTYDLLRQALEDAEQRDLISRSPIRQLRRSQKPQRDPAWKTSEEPYTLGELQRWLFDAEIPLVRRTYYSACVRLGTRPSETLGLCWSDLDDEGCVVIERQWHPRTRELAPLKGTRGEGAPRRVPVTDALRRDLERWRRGWERYVGRLPAEDDFIFASPTGRAGPLAYDTLADAGRSDAARLAVAWRGLHSFRRTLITQAQAAGVPEVWIRRVTHGRASDIVNRYTGSDLAALRRVVEAVAVEPPTPAEVVALPIASASGDYGAGYGVDRTAGEKGNGSAVLQTSPEGFEPSLPP